MNRTEYKKHSQKIKKIGDIGQMLAFTGFVAGATDLALEDVLPSNVRLLAGIGAGASFITGLILIAVAQSEHQKVIRDWADDISKKASAARKIATNPKAKVRNS